MRAYNYFHKTRVIFFVLVISFSLINPAIAKYADELTFLTPLPTGNNINDAWSPDGLNIFFAGDGGTIMFYDGSDFTIMPTPTDHALSGIHGTATNDIWAVGGNAYSDVKDPDRSVILHYNGSEWKHHTPPADSWGQYFPFNDVWADGDGTVWAVTRYTTSVARMTNKKWEFISTTGSPNFGLYSIYGFSPNNIFAAGACGQILRFNNGTWNLEREEEGGCTTMSTDLLYDIWGPDASNVFATGNNSQALKRNPDGTWKVLYAGGIFYNSSKFSINGSAADDVYFVGGSGEIDHWNGTEYKRLEIESDNSHNIILPDNMEGYYLGMDFGKISQFDGIMRSPLTTHIAASQSWKFAQRAQRIWLSQDVLRRGDTIYAWDGSRLRSYDPGIGDLHQIRVTTFKVFDENDIFLAGYQLGRFGYFAKRYNGTQWKDIVKNGQIVEMQDVARQGSDTFAIAGRNWDDDMDTFLGRPCILDDECYEDYNFSAITSDSTTVYAVGKNGAIISYANGTWSLENSSTDKDLTSVAAGGGWVCAAGRDRTIVCKQGNQPWQPVTGLDSKEENKFIGIAWSGEESFVAILNTGNDAASNYIGANKGTIYKIDKGHATLIRTGMSSVLGGIGSNSEGKVAIGGSGKVIYGNELPPIEKGAINPGIYMLLLDD